MIVGAGGRFTAMLSACVADCAGLLESATLIVKFTVPFGPVGEPVIAPVLAFRLSPAGRLPTVMLHVYGANPLLAVTVWL